MEEIFSSIEKISAPQQTANQLKQAIMTGQLPMGSKLPSERELAAQMGISRPVLREAIVMLSSYGLIVSKQGEGNFVADHFPESVLSFLGFGSNLNRSNYRYFFQCRELFEMGLAQLVVENATSSAIGELNRINQTFAKTDLDIQRHVEAEVNFHRTLISLAQNPLALELYSIVLKFMNASASCLLTTERIREEAYDAHRKIITALVGQDVEAYKQAVWEHLQVARGNMDAYYQQEK